MKFFNGLDNDLKNVLLAQLRNLWTHNSTALEGNTLTLGETAFVLEEGLTVSGKSLKDHEEIVGHARAIDLIYALVNQTREVTEQDLFELRKAVQIEYVADIYKPVGNWKTEPNGTYVVEESSANHNQKQIYLAYAEPVDVPVLMKQWLRELNMVLSADYDAMGYDEKGLEQLVAIYANLHVSFVRIHPFFDGNGRMARLLANLPVLKAGYPPITIQKENRREYIQLLSRYELAVGQPKINDEWLPPHKALEEFKVFCKTSWQASIKIVDEIKGVVQARHSSCRTEN